MKTGFIQSVLSTRKQRQRFCWVRNMAAFICAALVFHEFGDTLGGVLVALTLVLSYFTIAPIIAVAACLFEQMWS